MKFLIVDALYAQNLDAFYIARPEQKKLPYAQQLTEVVNDSGTCAAGWLVHELNQMQGLTASAVFANAPVLQQRWASEVGLQFDEADWLHDILHAQIQAARPDVLVVFPTTLLRAGFIDHVKLSCPWLQFVVAWDGVGAHSEYLIKEYDLILSCLEHSTAFYRARGKQAATLATGFNLQLYRELKSSELRYNTVFIGSLTGDSFYAERFRLLLELSRQREIALWLSRFPDWQPWSRMQLGLLRRFEWRRFREIWELGRRNLGTQFGRDMFRIFGQARICLNQHADFGGGHSSGNRRLWEATGMGVCLLTDWQPNLHEIFKIDEEVVTYRSVEECVEKMDYLLAHEDKRKAIAAAGMKRTHQQYSTRQFAENLVRNVRADLKV